MTKIGEGQQNQGWTKTNNCDNLIVTDQWDQEMRVLADRHYSRRTIGARQFLYSGRKLVIRNPEGTLLFAWLYPDVAMRLDNQSGYNCAIFRNQSNLLSSEVILKCEKMATEKWGPNRFYTYVNPSKIKSGNPGYCFKCAGWKKIGISKRGLHLLAKENPAMDWQNHIIRRTSGYQGRSVNSLNLKELKSLQANFVPWAQEFAGSDTDALNDLRAIKEALIHHGLESPPVATSEEEAAKEPAVRVSPKQNLKLPLPLAPLQPKPAEISLLQLPPAPIGRGSTSPAAVHQEKAPTTEEEALPVPVEQVVGKQTEEFAAPREEEVTTGAAQFLAA